MEQCTEHRFVYRLFHFSMEGKLLQMIKLQTLIQIWKNLTEMVENDCRLIVQKMAEEFCTANKCFTKAVNFNGCFMPSSYNLCVAPMHT
jgi:hypothetical protein